MDFSKEYIKLTNKFLWNFINNHQTENIVFSPYSIISLLALGANSTGSETREEILKAISEKLSIDDFNAIVAEYQRLFTSQKGFNSCNAAIVRADIKETIKTDYKEKIKKILDADLISSKNLNSEVDEWVKRKTGGLIEKISDELMTDILACLINAVLFDAKWREGYEEEDVLNGNFHNQDGSVSNKKFLNSTEKIYLENDYFTGFAKPYTNGYSFVGLLPKKKHSLSFIKRAIEGTDISELIKKASYEEVDVEIPEFTFEFQDNIKQICHELGIKKLFENGADFSEMSSADLKVDSIIHKARIELNRSGTKAAAVSATYIVAGCGLEPQRKSVILDRPFVYAIVHNGTSLPIFAGMVEN